MSGIKYVQGSTTINSGGTQNPSVQSGAIIGSTGTLSFTGSSASYAWTVSGPSGSTGDVSSASAAAPTIIFDVQGLWLIQLTDASANVYTLPLSVAKVAVTEFTGPVFAAYCTPGQVATPSLGYCVFQDSTNAGAVSAKDINGTVLPVQLTKHGAVRPTTGLSIGYMFFDTSLATNGRPIFWNGTGWYDSAGVSV